MSQVKVEHLLRAMRAAMGGALYKVADLAEQYAAEDKLEPGIPEVMAVHLGTVAVPRELLERVCGNLFSASESAIDELRALLKGGG